MSGCPKCNNTGFLYGPMMANGRNATVTVCSCNKGK